MAATTLDSIPNEVLEHIAFYASTSPLVGPPTALPALLSLNRKIYRALNIASNPHIYARIFSAKFDMRAPLRRINKSGENDLNTCALALELRRRCSILKRMRAQLDCRTNTTPPIFDRRQTEEENLDRVLWTAYLMMLENDGKNYMQLCGYGRIDDWIKVFWFERAGASLACSMRETQRWPLDDARASLGMWLFWFFLDPGKYTTDIDLMRRSLNIVKLYALGAHRYPLSRVPWISFAPDHGSDILLGTGSSTSFEPISNTFLNPQLSPQEQFTHKFTHSVSYFYNRDLQLIPPPAAVPAILSYLALRAKDAQMGVAGIGLLDLGDMPMEDVSPIPGLRGAGPQGSKDAFIANPVGCSRREMDSNLIPIVENDLAHGSEKWDYEWNRCLSDRDYGTSGPDDKPGRTFKPGSMEGVWEGVFSYTEFTSYASLLAGGSPSTLQNSLIAQHRQTWKIREHHLLAGVPFLSPGGTAAQDSATAADFDPVPIPVGDPIRAHMPEGASIRESPEGVEVILPSSFTYPRDSASPPASQHRSFYYRRFTPELAKSYERTRAEGGIAYDKIVRDIVLTGEGHSSWGEFRLVGRIRRCDGFVSVSKEYTDGDRGRWLYRGYLVGAGVEGEGHLVGRWRDTLSPTESHGYEGCFGMTRRC